MFRRMYVVFSCIARGGGSSSAKWMECIFLISFLCIVLFYLHIVLLSECPFHFVKRNDVFFWRLFLSMHVAWTRVWKMMLCHAVTLRY